MSQLAPDNASRKRQRVAALVATLVVMMECDEAPTPPHCLMDTFDDDLPWILKRARLEPAPLVRRRLCFWWDTAQHFSASEWRVWFRVPRSCFSLVVESIKGDPVLMVSANVGARAISVERQLAAFLLFVGSACGVRRTASLLDMSHEAVVTSCARVSEAINSQFKHELLMPINGSEKKKEVMQQFSAKRFGGAVGIIDCTKMDCVVPSEVACSGNAAVYWDRENNTCLSFQCVTDCQRSPRFLSVSGGVPGSTYDTKLFERSALCRNLFTRYLEKDEFLMGDNGYTLREWMMRGYSKKELLDGATSTRRTLFNKMYSGTRISCERAFGQVKARFVGIGKGLWFRTQDKYFKVFCSACILHNCKFSAVIKARTSFLLLTNFSFSLFTVCASLKDEWDEDEVVTAMEAEAKWKSDKATRASTAAVGPPTMSGGSLEGGRQRRERLLDHLF